MTDICILALSSNLIGQGCPVGHMWMPRLIKADYLIFIHMQILGACQQFHGATHLPGALVSQNNLFKSFTYSSKTQALILSIHFVTGFCTSQYS